MTDAGELVNPILCYINEKYLHGQDEEIYALKTKFAWSSYDTNNNEYNNTKKSVFLQHSSKTQQVSLKEKMITNGFFKWWYPNQDQETQCNL